MTPDSDSHLHAPKLSARAIGALAGASLVAAAVVAGLGTVMATGTEELSTAAAPEVTNLELPTYALDEPLGARLRIRDSGWSAGR